MEVGGEPFSLDSFTIALSSYEIILGTDWLRILGPVLWDINNHSLSCTIHGHRVT